MNTQILNKCIEELKQTNPKIDYILGMLETVVAMSGTHDNYVPQYPTIQPTQYPNLVPCLPYTTSNSAEVPIEEGSGIVSAYTHGTIAPSAIQ